MLCLVNVMLYFYLGQGGYVFGTVGLFSVRLPLLLSVRHITQSSERITIKFYGGVQGNTRNVNRLW